MIINIFSLQKLSQNLNQKHQIFIQTKDQDGNLVFLISFTNPDSDYPNEVIHQNIHAINKDSALMQIYDKYPSAQIKRTQRRITKLIVQKGSRPRSGGSCWQNQLSMYQMQKLQRADIKKQNAIRNRNLKDSKNIYKGFF